MAKRESSARRGPAGQRGVRGKTGKTGLTGPAGPAGVSPTRADVLAMVEDQFTEIRKELSIQLTRMGQIQVQLDQIHGLIKKLVQSE
jgi:hypothetical protein